MSGSPTPDQTTEQLWEGFKAFVATAESADKPRLLVDQYHDRLIEEGFREEEAEHAVAVILQELRDSPDGWITIFNRLYTVDAPGFSTNPNQLLVSVVDDLPPGRALDAGMGQGRNSVFLATRGWDVTGFDIADEGVAAALRHAEDAGVSIDARVLGHADFDYGTDEWDLIVITYEPFPVVAPEFNALLHAALRLGGVLVVESFASPADAEARRPVDIDPDLFRGALDNSGFELLLSKRWKTSPIGTRSGLHSSGRLPDGGSNRATAQSKEEAALRISSALRSSSVLVGLCVQSASRRKPSLGNLGNTWRWEWKISWNAASPSA